MSIKIKIQLKLNNKESSDSLSQAISELQKQQNLEDLDIFSGNLESEITQPLDLKITEVSYELSKETQPILTNTRERYTQKQQSVIDSGKIASLKLRAQQVKAQSKI